MKRAAPWMVLVVFVGGMATTTLLHVASGSQGLSDTGDDLGVMLSLTAFTFIGAYIISKQPTNAMGWLFCSLGLMLGVFPIGDAYATYVRFTTGAFDDLAVFALWSSAWYWFPLLTVMFVYIPMLYPTGRFLSKRWRWVSYAALGSTVVFVVMGMFAPTLELQEVEGVTVANPIGQPWGDFEDSPYSAPFFVLWSIVGLAGVASTFVRFRRSRGEERLQMKWFAFGVALIPTAFLAENIPYIGELYNSVMWIALPVGAGIAILKYRLYEIDVVISKTVVFAGLATFITAIYVGIVVGVGSLLGAGGEPNLALSIVATAVVAVAFQPVRERLTRLANRLVYGKRATPYEVLSRFSSHLGETVATEQTLERMARLLADGTGAAHAQVSLAIGGQMVPAAAVGEVADASAEAHTVEVTHQGETLGALSVTKKRGEALTPADVKLVDDLAAQAGLLLRNVRLTEQLKAKIVDLRASRQRLVAAQDAERRRLERDLHDGAQQQIVAMKLKLGIARTLAERESAPKTVQLVQQLTEQTDEAVQTLRELAHGIYPPLLAAEGLMSAISTAARRAPVPVTVETDGVGRYGQDVESAIYFCVLEAITNAAKHADASLVTVRLSESNGHLGFEVSDDGTGFDATAVAKGHGTTNMTDRLDALSGVLDITSVPGDGTTVRGRLPVLASQPEVLA